VEIDPYDPASTPRKRTRSAASRTRRLARAVRRRSRPVYYLGDDNRGDYIYKFVSATPWDPADATAANRLAVGDKYLDSGTLLVARFEADGTGAWLPLVFGQGPLTPANVAYPFANQATS
jgi:secreted PhoX family phosphatase